MNDEQLFEVAKGLSREKVLSEDAVSGYVGAALLTTKGAVHTGVSLSGSCGIGYCGEVGAILSMLQSGESRIARIVAVSNDFKRMPPCGRCREMMYQVDRGNLETVLLLEGKTMLLRELLPERWQELWE